MHNLEHPDITAARATGYPRNKQLDVPVCPVCGAECETIFIFGRYRRGDVVGCDMCLMALDAWEWREEI